MKKYADVTFQMLLQLFKEVDARVCRISRCYVTNAVAAF